MTQQYRMKVVCCGYTRDNQTNEPVHSPKCMKEWYKPVEKLPSGVSHGVCDVCNLLFHEMMDAQEEEERT